MELSEIASEVLDTGGSAEGASCARINNCMEKMEVETNKESEGHPTEALKDCDQDEHVGRSSDLVDSPDVHEHPFQSPFLDEIQESDIIEHDVKVCDICGDAGREDLLAICSRCSDGAEHTYCMREMVDKVPDSEWLCEECKITEENDKQKKEVDGRKTNKVSAIQVPSKRKAEHLEDFSTVREKDLETNIGSPKSTSPIKAAVLSKNSSLKNLNMGTVRPAPQISNCTQIVNDVAESGRTPTSSSTPRMQSAKGSFMKSNSFSILSSKPKVKLVDDAFLQRQKGVRERASLDMDGIRMMTKSKSFKPMNSARSNAAESKEKILSSAKSSNVQELKGMKHVREQNSFERKGLSKLDHPPANSTKISSNIPALKSRGEVLLSSVSNKRDSKAVKSDDKLTALSKVTSHMARRGSENTGTSVGALSGDEKSNQISPKDEYSESSTFWDAGKSSITANKVLPAGLSRLRKSTNQFEKSNGNSISHSRQTPDSRSIPCQKCEEVGHDKEFCTVCNKLTGEIDVSSAKSLREEGNNEKLKAAEEGNKENKLKAAITAAMLKKPGIINPKKPLPDKSDELSASSMDLSSEIPYQEQSSYPNNLKTIISSKVIETQVIMKQFTPHPTEAASYYKIDGPNPIVPSDPKLRKKDLPSHTSASMCFNLRVSAIPEIEYIWQGDFELSRCGKYPDLCDGIQAHLSTYASPKVLGMVNKFPAKIPLTEVPRLSTWPTQFHESGAKEDNIALYFFAKDLDSYHRNYKSLLESMMKNDIALKGNMDGVELLIFPSNHLPQNFRHWNALYFLWGVFRARRVRLDQNFGSSKKEFVPSMNFPSLENVIPPAVMSVSEIPKGEDFTSCTRSIHELSELKPSACLKSPIQLSSKIIVGDSGTKMSNVHHRCINLRENLGKQDRMLEPATNPFAKAQTSNLRLRPEAGCCNTSKNEPTIPDSELDAELQSPVRAVRTNYDLNEVEKMPMDWDTSHLLGTSSRSSPFVNGNNIMVYGETPCKKMKIDNSRMYEYNRSRDSSSKIDGLASHTGDTSMVEERHDEACEKKVILEDMEATQKYIFPVDMHSASNLWLTENTKSWKKLSSDENQIQDRVPNLELALGAEKKPSNRGVLPFFGGMMNERKNQEIARKQEDAISASLSLSLSFPSPEKSNI